MIPFEADFYEKAATVLLTIQNYEAAEKILQESIRIRETYFAIKWLGQIALKNQNYDKAIELLEKGRLMKSNDTQLLFNLGRAYYFSGRNNYGDEILRLLKRIEPNSKYTTNLQSVKIKS